MVDRLYNGALVQVEGVKRSFGSGSTMVHVLRGIDLTVEAGELIALYGPSGSGKTTLLNLIGALDKPTAGVIKVCKMDIVRMSERRRSKLRRKNLGFIFQNYTLMPSYTSAENIDLALRLPGLWVWERRKRIRSALEAVGLSAWANHMPDQLSGGQRQRVAIARALALRPAVILADEPTSGLDTRMARRVLALFQGIARAQGTAFLIVSHDPMIAEFVDTTYDLQDGMLHKRVKGLPVTVEPHHGHDHEHAPVEDDAKPEPEAETKTVEAKPEPVAEVMVEAEAKTDTEAKSDVLTKAEPEVSADK